MLVLMSSTMGNAPEDGAPKAIGLVEILRSRPPNGATHCPAPPPLDTEVPLPPSATAIQRGQVLFQRWGCTGCHVDEQSANAPSLVGIGDVYLGELRTKARARASLRAFLQEPKLEARLLSRGEAYGTKMPPLTTGVDGGLDDLLTFLLSRSGQLPVSEAR